MSKKEIIKPIQVKPKNYNKVLSSLRDSLSIKYNDSDLRSYVINDYFINKLTKRLMDYVIIHNSTINLEKIYNRSSHNTHNYSNKCSKYIASRFFYTMYFHSIKVKNYV